MKRLLSYFLQGLLYVVPLFVTIYVLYQAVSLADGLFAGVPVVRDVPGAGLLLTVLGVSLCGYFGPRLMSTPLHAAFERLINWQPLVKMIYGSVRDLMRGFVGGGKRKFDHPVSVSLDEQGCNCRLGFVTQADLARLDLPGMCAVYVPYPYSIMGELMIVPAARVKALPIGPAELMKMAVSGGVAGASAQEEDNNKAN